LRNYILEQTLIRLSRANAVRSLIKKLIGIVMTPGRRIGFRIEMFTEFTQSIGKKQ
jgi:hypothetical protein